MMKKPKENKVDEFPELIFCRGCGKLLFKYDNMIMIGFVNMQIRCSSCKTITELKLEGTVQSGDDDAGKK